MINYVSFGLPGAFSMFTPHQLLLLRNAVDHYVKYQIGANSRDSREYKEIMVMIEQLAPALK